MIDFFINNEFQFLWFAKMLVLPPGGPIFLIFVGLLLFPFFRTWPKLLVVLGWSYLAFVSLPLVSYMLMNKLQQQTQVLTSEKLQQIRSEGPQAIVILGGGRRYDAREYQQAEMLSPLSAERARYGAYLHNKTGLPIFTTGGLANQQLVSEAQLVSQFLHREYNIKPKWQENLARNTLENAKFSALTLKNVDVEHVVLVTHAWHMPRAKYAFEMSGLKVTEAPTGLEAFPQHKDKLFMPSAQALFNSTLAINEWLGIQWYRWRYNGE